MTRYRIDGVDATVPDGPVVLQDLSFEVAAGEIVGIVGRSGVGKTTLLRLLAGLLPSRCGTVTFDGAGVSGPPPGVAMVFQDYHNALLPWRTVARNTGLGLEGRVPATELTRRVQAALTMVGLAEVADEYPGRLSGGMAQRAQIGRALALDARVLLMDEPFGALDAITKATLQDVLLGVQQQTGATVVFVTHDLDEAIYLSDRVLVLAGRPGTVTVTAATCLPRPRDQVATRELPAYLGLRHLLSAALRDGADG